MLTGIKILMIEDEEKITEVVKAYLEKEGCIFFSATDGASGLLSYKNNQPDLVLLDRMLPRLSGDQVCVDIRSQGDTPIIMLTARISEEEIIGGLQTGADDYVTKPFRMGELIARIEALLRRTRKSGTMLSWDGGAFRVDLISRQVFRCGEEVVLTPSEWNLLELFIRHPRQVFTREHLIAAAFGEDYEGFDRTVDVHIKNLRSKIETDTANPRYILTVRGAGYRFSGEGKDIGT